MGLCRRAEEDVATASLFNNLNAVHARSWTYKRDGVNIKIRQQHTSRTPPREKTLMGYVAPTLRMVTWRGRSTPSASASILGQLFRSVRFGHEPGRLAGFGGPENDPGLDAGFGGAPAEKDPGRAARGRGGGALVLLSEASYDGGGVSFTPGCPAAPAPTPAPGPPGPPGYTMPGPGPAAAAAAGGT